MTSSWNPWHGCTKISPGCKYCYVYRQDAMYGTEIYSSEVRKTGVFALPVKRKRDKSYKISPGTLVYTCFTSDFWVKEADEWRKEAWGFIRERSDLLFFIFTKRIDRFTVSLPEDWGEGYENVIVGCTVENQKMVDYRLPIFNRLPIRHKAIIAAPLLEHIDISAHLNTTIEQVAVSGESGNSARECNYDWILDLRKQCLDADIPFQFHQTGANFIKEGKRYRINRCYQIAQAKKANINYRIAPDGSPE